MQQAYRNLSVTATAVPSWKTYRGKRTLTFPITALVADLVVEGLLSDGPELVPADVLAAAPAGWNGRPLVPFHPDGGANFPEVWEHDVIGQVFDAHFDTSLNALRMTVYLDPEAAEAAGEGAIAETVLAGEMVEVSVGAYVWLIEETGNSKGKGYVYRWQSITPEHVAIGLARHGGLGSCSIHDGCGGPRAMAQPLRTFCDCEDETTDETYVDPALLQRLGITQHQLNAALAVDAFVPVDPYNLDPEQARALGYRPQTKEADYRQSPAFKKLAANPNAPPDPYGLSAKDALALGYVPRADWLAAHGRG